MGMVAILVMWPGPFEHTFVPPSHRSSIWNMTFIGPVVSEEKMFKECGQQQQTDASNLLFNSNVHVYIWRIRFRYDLKAILVFSE